MPRETHDDEGMVWACPECDRAPVYRRTGSNAQHDPDSTFVCYGCQSTFDEPVERESRRSESDNTYNGFDPEMRDALRD